MQDGFIRPESFVINQLAVFSESSTEQRPSSLICIHRLLSDQSRINRTDMGKRRCCNCDESVGMMFSTVELVMVRNRHGQRSPMIAACNNALVCAQALQSRRLLLTCHEPTAHTHLVISTHNRNPYIRSMLDSNYTHEACSILSPAVKPMPPLNHMSSPAKTVIAVILGCVSIASLFSDRSARPTD